MADYVPITGSTKTSNHEVNGVQTGVMTLALDKNSDHTINITVSGSLNVTASTLDRSITKKIILNVYANTETTLSWPTGTIWTDDSAPENLEANTYLTVFLLLANGLIMASSTLYKSEGEVIPPLPISSTFLAVGLNGAVVYGADPANFNVTTAGAITLESVSYRQLDGMFVAVGQNGRIAYGTNPSSFSLATRGTDYLRSVVCRQSDGMFAVVGQGGRVVYGTDPSNFTMITVGTNEWGKIICRERDGLFVAVGQGGKILYGTDPSNLNMVVAGTVAFLSVTCRQSDGMFVVVGVNGVVA